MATTLEMLMALNQQLPPVPPPAQPVGLGPIAPPVGVSQQLPPGPPPDMAPPAPLPRLDEGFIAQYAGAQPAAPTLRDPSFIDKLATALLGVSTGIQGRAPQYIESVREERQRPIREYQRQLEQFNQRRTQGLEIATRRQERQQEQTQRTADTQANREFQTWLRQANITDEAAIQQARQAFELQKVREQERIVDERQQQRERTQQERDARLIARDFGKVGAKPAIALQLGRYYSGLVDEISPEAAKFESAQARLAEIRARRAAIGGTGGSGGPGAKALKAAEEIQSIKDKMVEAEARGDQQTVKQLLTRAKSAIRLAARFPEVEAGFDPSGKWPYVKLRGAQGSVALPGYEQPQGQQQAGPVMATPPPDTVQAYMQRWGVSKEQALRELMGQE